ncbi:MAG: nucleotidyltransferase substrate binding protein [Spirochaetaceae bacterium]|jgi:nucleotidyltransferase substrate binding protein (TIGR01987 family)|nr:nucleotidyltransferase substrate binding protein [Spirochaetaceae bacterium]
MDKDIRWLQRFDNYTKALKRLDDVVALAGERALSDIEEQGMVKAFEFTFELAWNVMKDFLSMKGITGIIGSKDSVRHAFNQGLIADGQIWMGMIDSRNEAAHTYDEATKDRVVAAITGRYWGELNAFAETMQNYAAEQKNG